jgi:hypothetical protein
MEHTVKNLQNRIEMLESRKTLQGDGGNFHSIGLFPVCFAGYYTGYSRLSSLDSKRLATGYILVYMIDVGCNILVFVHLSWFLVFLKRSSY